MAFKSRMDASAKKAGSNIVLALDIIRENREFLLRGSLEILDATNQYLCAVKVNRQLVLPLGLFDGVEKVLRRAKDLGLPTIMDCKINDVGYTNREIARRYFEAGFDAVIVNPFVGWEDGLQPVFELAKKLRRGVITLVYMSHKAAWEGYGQTVYDPSKRQNRLQYLVFAEKALSWGADGAVVGATYPEKIREVYHVLGDSVAIYSPGVGVQGGGIEAAVKSGARYLIVGRSITRVSDPGEAAKRVRDEASKFLGV